MDTPDDVVFRIHYNGVFHYDPLMYEQFRVVEMHACTSDRVMFSQLIDMLVTKIKDNIWALFFCISGLYIDSGGLKLIENNADVHALYDLAEKHKHDGNMSVEELVAWGEEEARSPYLRSPPLKSRPFRNDMKDDVGKEDLLVWCSDLENDCMNDVAKILETMSEGKNNASKSVKFTQGVQGAVDGITEGLNDGMYVVNIDIDEQVLARQKKLNKGKSKMTDDDIVTSKKRKVASRGIGISIKGNDGDNVVLTDYETDSDEHAYQYSESDTDHLDKSFDYLSNGEDELIEHRKRTIQFKVNGAEVPKVGDEERSAKVDQHTTIYVDKKLKGKGMGITNPFAIVEESNEMYPIYDDLTHWKLKKPKLGEKFPNGDKFKECLTFYALANGFSLNAKNFALTEGDVTIQAHYGYLRSYAKALVDSNEGSTVKVGVTVNPDEKTYFDSKRRAFWSLNEDILKITILKTNTPYPSRKIRRIRACTHQRPQRNEAQYASIEEVIADKGKKSSMETFVPNDEADYYSGITSITVNRKNAYELKGKFLDDLHNNAFSGTDGKDAVEHIEYYLKIIDLIKLPNVDHDKLRVVVFPIPLAGGARRCHGLIKEFGRSQHQSNILPSLSTIKLEVRNGQPVAGDRMVIVMEEIFPVLTILETCSITKTLNGTWYEDLENNELKDEALRNKAIMEGLISNNESSNDCWKRWKIHEIYYHNYDKGEYENKTYGEEHELCGIKTHEVPVCQIKRYKMIRYSFNDEEYVAVKKDEYDDLTITSEEACRAYQEIFRMMDEGWMVTRTE
ncbi:hypothetical protein Tco_0544013 [Tanacetum coccineum]